MTASQDIQDSFDESLNLNSQGRSSCTLKRQVEGDSSGTRANSSGVKRFCNGIVSAAPTEGEAVLPKFTGFLTAGSNREIKVSEEALNLARARLDSPVDTFSEEESLNGNGNATVAALPFTGFVTAGSNKVIAVTEASLLAAKRRLDTLLETDPQTPVRIANEENLDPSRGPLLRSSSTSKRTVEFSGTPVRTRSSRNRFNSPFRAPDMVKPIASAGAPAKIAAGATPDAVSVAPSRITCIRDLRNCKSSSVDFLGIIVEAGSSVSHTSGGVPVIKVADRYGESISIELLSCSIPTNIARGSVISIEGALVKRSQGTVSLVLSDSAFVDLEPSDPEAECLHRLFSTGLFDATPTEDSFSLENTTLRMVARLNEYLGETSTIMARISSVNLDALVYLGCTNCKLLVSPNPRGVVSCQHCSNNKARYFYSLAAELADFSGVISVTLSDDTAEKLIGRPAGAMVKLSKEALRTR
ncbi:hypothetical protein ANCCAN_21546 [Ancylostoma caninum]|uniref:Replication factor A C-terminal domain-containing protein n=1 Tax=Ancylostoma caninum TaxID=29170 RepID=A0A368FK88_ANCCA|nr:hypothetical protein ANCCAN_21546 [Ancylostoma caninum]